MSFDNVIFDGKSLSDVFSEIYKNTGDKRQQINAFVTKLVLLIRTPEDAAVLAPVIKDFIEVNVKNDEHLIRIAQIAQRLVVVNTKGGSDSIEGLLTDDEKRNLLSELSVEITKVQTESEDLEQTIHDLSSKVLK